MHASIIKYTSISKSANEFENRKKCENIYGLRMTGYRDNILIINIEYIGNTILHSFLFECKKYQGWTR